MRKLGKGTDRENLGRTGIGLGQSLLCEARQCTQAKRGLDRAWELGMSACEVGNGGLMARVRWPDDGEVDMASGVRGLLALAVGERRSVGRTSLKVNWQRFRRFPSSSLATFFLALLKG